MDFEDLENGPKSSILSQITGAIFKLHGNFENFIWFCPFLQKSHFLIFAVGVQKFHEKKVFRKGGEKKISKRAILTKN